MNNQKDCVVLKPELLNKHLWQVRSYEPDQTHVMVIVGMERWLFDAAELVASILAVSSPVKPV